MCRRLMSMPGIGAVVALTYRSAVDDPARFTSSKKVGPWAGLTPTRNQSGERDVAGGITKANVEAQFATWESFVGDIKDFVAEYTPTLHVSDAGDMAYDIGRYRISMVKDEGPVSFVGKYVVVWKKVDGQWRAMLDMDNDNGPEAQA